MQTKRTASIRPPAISDAGVLFLYGPNLGLRIRYGSLVIDDGRDRTLVVNRAGRPKLGRLVIAGHGWWSFEVTRWLAEIGASWVQLDLAGGVLGSGPGAISPDLPALRRAQALAAGTDVGTEIGRWLLTLKLRAQAAALATIDDADEASTSILDHVGLLEGCSTSEELRYAEARAAVVFWTKLAPLPMSFVPADAAKVPTDWLSVGPRRSALTGSPRSASTAAHACWNFAYACAASEVEVALRSVGLDPGISPTFLHSDERNRSGATYDAIEAIRGDVDRPIIQMLSARRFRRRDFVQLPDGRARLTAPLARSIAEAVIPVAREAIGPIAEELSRRLADVARGTPKQLNVPTNLTGAARSRGRDGIRRGARKPTAVDVTAAKSLVPRSCIECAADLGPDEPTARYCSSCRSDARTRDYIFIDSGRRALADLRAREDDPSRSTEARAKQRASKARRDAERREWESVNDVPDPSDWEAIFAGLAHVTLPAIQRATGLSRSFAWQIRRGDRRPHSRHWEALRSLVESK